MNPASRSNRIITGFSKSLVLSLMRIQIFFMVLGICKSLSKSMKVVRKITAFRRKMHGIQKPLRIIKNDGRYFMSVHIPGWPSSRFNQFMKQEIIRQWQPRTGSGNVQIVVFAITNKCPLQCKHCGEWQNLNKGEVLQLSDLEKITDILIHLGVDVIELSGGEPINRFADACSLIRKYASRVDFWMLTSGYGLTLEKAMQLKKAGLKGMNISLDHWDENKHNAFRGNKHAFFEAIHAAELARSAGILVSLTLCTTRSFVTRENLLKYIELAKTLKMGFVQFLEPRAVGHYMDEKDFGLDVLQKEQLKEVFLKINNDPGYNDYPFLIYPGYHQEQFGCSGAGFRYFYIDPTGGVHACPFCRGDTGNILTRDMNELLEKIRERGCQFYRAINPEEQRKEK